MSDKQVSDFLYQKKDQLLMLAQLVATSKIVSTVFHDLNQPMCGIRGYAQLADMQLEETAPVKKYLKTVNDQADLLSAMLAGFRQSLLPVERQKTKFNLTAIFRDTLEQVTNQVKSRGIKLESHVCDEALEMQGSEDDFRNIMLLAYADGRDAIAFCKDRKGEIKISLQVKGDQIVMTFSDNGVGYSKEELNAYFEPFQKPPFQPLSTGLEHYLLKILVDENNGEIKISSEKNTGTTLVVSFPKK